MHFIVSNHLKSFITLKKDKINVQKKLQLKVKKYFVRKCTLLKTSECHKDKLKNKQYELLRTKLISMRKHINDIISLVKCTLRNH